MSNLQYNGYKWKIQMVEKVLFEIMLINVTKVGDGEGAHRQTTIHLVKNNVENK